MLQRSLQAVNNLEVSSGRVRKVNLEVIQAANVHGEVDRINDGDLGL